MESCKLDEAGIGNPAFSFWLPGRAASLFFPHPTPHAPSGEPGRLPPAQRGRLSASPWLQAAAEQRIPARTAERESLVPVAAACPPQNISPPAVCSVHPSFFLRGHYPSASPRRFITPFHPPLWRVLHLLRTKIFLYWAVTKCLSQRSSIRGIFFGVAQCEGV